MTTRYLVDNNALIALKRDRVTSTFFRTHCQVTADVLREADEHPCLAQLKAGSYTITPAVLEQLRTVMADVAVGDVSLIDLYGNKGSADPGLVASALDAMAANEGTLFGDDWIIVTNDRGVEDAAERHGVVAIKPVELAALIDETGARARFGRSWRARSLEGLRNPDCGLRRDHLAGRCLGARRHPSCCRPQPS